jgi:hypothetical protein
MVVRSALRPGRPLPPRKISWYLFWLEAESTQGHSAAGRVRSVECRYLPRQPRTIRSRSAETLALKRAVERSSFGTDEQRAVHRAERAA